MKFFPWFLAVSITANVLMAGLWLQARMIRAGHQAAARGDVLPLRPVSAAMNSGAEFRPAPVAAPEVLRRTSWLDLQSDDLKELIRRLRGVECPEETIQDLIVAEVNRRFQARSLDLWPDRFVERPFWKTQARFDLSENKKNRERWNAERELRKEKSQLLVDLLGVDPEKERAKADGIEDWQDWQVARFDFVPESKREAVSKYLDEFNDRMQEFYKRNQGLYDGQFRAELKQLETERLQGLAQFLTPQEIREYELRESQTASQLSHDLRLLSLSREQYQAIFDIRKKYGETIYDYGDADTKEARDQIAETKKAMQSEIVAAWGPDKAKDYERSQDYSYQQIAELVKRTDLPADTVAKVYDYKEAAEKSAQQVRQAPALTPQQRDAALQRIREETEKTLKATLPERVYKKYLYNGGWWINNLAPAPSRPAAPGVRSQ